MKQNICHVVTVIDGSTEDTVEVFRIPGFQLSAFCAQFGVPSESDPDMLDRYAVGPDDVAFLLHALQQDVRFDFTRNAYFIEAVEDDL
jgi:hypothetical protein